MSKKALGIMMAAGTLFGLVDESETQASSLDSVKDQELDQLMQKKASIEEKIKMLDKKIEMRTSIVDALLLKDDPEMKDMLYINQEKLTDDLDQKERLEERLTQLNNAYQHVSNMRGSEKTTQTDRLKTVVTSETEFSDTGELQALDLDTLLDEIEQEKTETPPQADLITLDGLNIIVPDKDGKLPETSLEDSITEELGALGVLTPNGPSVNDFDSDALDYDEGTVDSPVDHEDINEVPIYDEGILDTPIYDESINDAPNYDEDTANTPIYDEGILDSPVDNENTVDTPIYDEGTLDTPINDENINDTPIYDEDTANTPVYDENINDTPIYENNNEVSSQAGSIIDSSYKYLGTPYVWGGSDPSGFDCSGFVQYVYAENGVSLPRVTTDQEYAGTYLSVGELQAGDLVFFGDRGATYHVGIYLGDGFFIHAPEPGDSVKVTALSDFPPSFGVRVL